MSVDKITKLYAREILDSRGNPTIEVEVETESGVVGVGVAPSGASVGKYEMLELRDNDSKRYHGKGVLKAVSNVKEIIAPEIKSISVFEQRKIDEILVQIDSTKNRSHLGANAMLAVSSACLNAAAKTENKLLCQYLNPKSTIMPRPMVNVLNGGVHANNLLDIQEFMIVPEVSDLFSENIRCATEIFHSLKKILQGKNYSTAVGDEGGFAPNIQSTKEALDSLLLAIEKSGYKPGENVNLALDCAASEFYRSGSYNIHEKGLLSSEELVGFYHSLLNSYPILSIEDGMSEGDDFGWEILTSKLSNSLQLVGDDLFVTNKEIFTKYSDKNIANAILIKPNQIGTITETLDIIKLAKSRGYKTVMSHRSGETEDTIISHLAVSSEAGQIKTGSTCRTDRTAKYNELIRIEDKLILSN